MNLLYVNACPRLPGISRTRRLADAYLAAFRAAHPRARVLTHDLPVMGLAALDGNALSRREALIDARAWSEPVFSSALAFARADAVVVAAPYWDLMFPAMLKVYVEHLFVRELTFRYQGDTPIGLCRARRALYLTSAGGLIADCDFGTAYLRAAFAMLGIPRFEHVAAEGLDMAYADAESLLAPALARAARLGREA